jgi:hypothetical protein
MHARAPTTQKNTVTVDPRALIACRSPGFLGSFPTFRNAKAGSTKSRGVNPTAPQTDTKSPKKGIAAATRVIAAMYTEVYISRHTHALRLVFFA